MVRGKNRSLVDYFFSNGVRGGRSLYRGKLKVISWIVASVEQRSSTFKTRLYLPSLRRPSFGSSSFLLDCFRSTLVSERRTFAITTRTHGTREREREFPFVAHSPCLLKYDKRGHCQVSSKTVSFKKKTKKKKKIFFDWSFDFESLQSKI